MFGVDAVGAAAMVAVMNVKKGQRWMSTAEPELGPGIVEEADRRRVRLRFPASDETRVYALESAPIQRMMFRPGDKVGTVSGMAQVEAVREQDGLWYYLCGGGEVCESEVTADNNLSTADRRLLDGRTDPCALAALRRSAWDHRARIQKHPAHGYLGARIDLIPHQLYIARELAERRRPRALLADEVGLGKTIEACLVLHRLVVRGRAGRVLILVPDALVHQWFVELYRRFHLTCAIFDEARCAGAGVGNAFLDEHLVLAGVSLFQGHPERVGQALEADWGMVIVDEAHHLRWSLPPGKSSEEYLLVEALARKSPGLLLLTGTPEQFGLEGHFARLRLIDPERYPDLDAFRAEADTYHRTASKMEGLLGGGQEAEERARELLDRHGTGRAVYRNTRAAVRGFPKRKLHPAPLEPAVEDAESGCRARDEAACELGAAERPARECDSGDPRVEWLVGLLQKHPEEKFLLICRYRERAEALYEAVKQKINLDMTVFHEDQTLVQRDRNAAWFAKPGVEGARLLICSEIGSEGRNFQFAHHLVLFDLPADPELLEQRIGRLDRIGQRETIHIHVPYFKTTAGELLFRWFADGVDAFARPVRGGAVMLEKFLPELRRLATGAWNEKKVAALVDASVVFRGKLEAKLEKGRDRLLEWHSCRPAVVASVIKEMRTMDQSRDLDAFLLAAFDHFGVHVEKLGGGDGERTWLLMPGHTMSAELAGIPPEGKIVTLDRATALDRDEVEFLSWDHPLVTAVTDLLLGSEAGNASFTVARDVEGLEPGIYGEFVFVLEPRCPARLEPGRFLPPTPLCVVVDAHGRTLDEETTDALERAAVTDAPRHALSGQSAALGSLMESWTEPAREKVETMAGSLRADALKQMDADYAAEIDRLHALARRSGRPVDQAEAAALEEERGGLREAIAGAAPRLDAIRLVRITDR